MPEQPVESLAAYLHSCFAWEFSNSSQVSLSGSATLAAYQCQVETVASGLTARPLLAGDQYQKLNAALSRNKRGTCLIYGLFPIALPSRHNPDKTESLPLYLCELEPWSEDQMQSGSDIEASMLFVNRLLLERLVDPEESEALASQLQQIIDDGPLDKAAIASMQASLGSAVPDMRFVGLNRFPLCRQLADLDIDSDDGNAPVLHCTAVVLLTRRSNQSMGILYELGQLQHAKAFSSPIRKLVVKQKTGDYGLSRLSLNKKALCNRVIGALSPAQVRAVQAAQQHELSVVFGPPGCGKTHTLAMMTANTVALGGSVLICARNAAAVDVINRFLQEHLWLGGATVNGGSHTDRRSLKRRIQSTIQAGAVPLSTPHPVVVECLSSDRPLQALRSAIRYNHGELARLDRAKHWLEQRFVDQTASVTEYSLQRMLGRFWNRFVGYTPAVLVDKTQTPADLTDALDQLLSERDNLVRASIQLNIQYRTLLVLEKQRQTLSDLADSFTAREYRQRQLHGTLDYSKLLATLPVWVTTLSDLSQLLPLQKELFDLLIIDEASQADMASGLPALQRARRAVVMGDTEQLRHVSFLPLATEQAFQLRHYNAAGKFELPGYRRTSLLDLANSQLTTASASQFLDEHFRSAPAIIGFSDKMFYQNKLKLLTMITHRDSAKPLDCVRVEDGARHKSGHNPNEASTILHYLEQLLTTDAPSVAVLSPFRAQCDYLQKIIDKKISQNDRDRVDLLVGTAHELQGEERDVVLLSTVVDNQSPGGAIAFLSRPDVMNVSITRAKKKVVLFLSRDTDRFDPQSLFGQYVDWVLHGHEKAQEQFCDASSEALAVYQSISSKVENIGVDYNVQIGDIVINLLVYIPGRQLGIDLIGFNQSHNRNALSIESYAILARAGLKVIPVTHNEWSVEQSGVIERVRQHLGT